MKKAELLAEQERLLKRANELAQLHWGVEYTGTLRLVNRHWRAYNGRYFGRRSEGIQEIVMSAQRNEERPPEDVERTLLHELVHWRLWTLGLPCGDKEPEFVAEALRVGASFSHTEKAQKAYEKYVKETGGIAV